MADQTTIQENRAYIIDFHKQSINLWNESQKTLQEDSDRIFSKIKSCARELSELMTDHSILSIAHTLSKRKQPDSDKHGEPEDLEKNLQVLRRQFIPILNIVSRMNKPSAENVPINHVRRFTISLFFEYCWDKHEVPTDPDFISACVDLFRDSGDPIDQTTAEDIIKVMPEHLFPFSKEKLKFSSSLFS